MKPSVAEAKERLFESSPSPADLFPSRVELIRKHPWESVAVGVVLGVVVGASPRLRKLVLDVGLAAARALIK